MTKILKQHDIATTCAFLWTTFQPHSYSELANFICQCGFADYQDTEDGLAGQSATSTAIFTMIKVQNFLRSLLNMVYMH